jgi:hypothetical protein
MNTKNDEGMSLGDNLQNQENAIVSDDCKLSTGIKQMLNSYVRNSFSNLWTFLGKKIDAVAKDGERNKEEKMNIDNIVVGFVNSDMPIDRLDAALNYCKQRVDSINKKENKMLKMN